MTTKAVNDPQAKIRLLLALWDLDGTKTEVAKGKLTKRVVRKSQKVSAYQGLFDELEEAGALKTTKNKFSLSPKGVEMLGEMLKSGEVKFGGTIIGTWVANALAKWVAQTNGAVSVPTQLAKAEEKAITQSVAPQAAIASYDEFKEVALDVYDKLNRDYNLDDLVPIYRMRRVIGDRVSRSQFNEWLLEMQANDILQLQGGSVEDSAPDKIEDSITTELDGLRCYARRLIA
ncbi:hypothetical protein [Lyngbya aestuarii]|uniref:hypothetical protein n=1 Tax=Lyngbya aestuarii TaxID=118322 RepID=UPI00403DB805